MILASEFAASERVNVQTVRAWCRNMHLGRPNKRLPIVSCQRRGSVWVIDSEKTARLRELSSSTPFERELRRRKPLAA